jgi:chromosome segregation ATPase
MLMLMGCSLAWGEAARRGGGEETARLQMMLQQLNSEKTALAAENARLKKELEGERAKLEKLESEATTSRQKLGATSSDLATARARGDAVQRSFDTLKSRFEELVAQYRKTVDVMRELEVERDRLSTLAADYDVRVATCERNNDALYKAAGELIELYEKKGFMSVLAQREPVTKLKRTQIENLMDEYRQLADDMRLKYESTTTEPPLETDGKPHASGEGGANAGES